MKIALLNPFSEEKFPIPPTSLLSIAASLEGEGHQVEIIDSNVIKEESKVIDLINSKEIDILGVTSMTPHINSTIKLLKKIKKRFPIILGGPHATVFPEKTLKDCPEIDVIIMGEGDITIKEVASAIENSVGLSQIKGIGYKERGEIKINAFRELIPDLDVLPMPAYHLIDVNNYAPHPPHGRRMPFMALLTSRGCPYRCVFCVKSIFGRTFRGRSPKLVLEEIKLLIKNYGIKEIMFYDDSFTINKERIKEICKLIIDEKIDLAWSCETRVNLVNLELLRVMKRAGCYMISYGVESGSQMILDSLKKDVTIQQIREAFYNTSKARIQSVAYMMLGAPGETIDTVKKTIGFVKEINPDFVQFSICTPYPGNELYELAKKEGIVTDNDFDNFVYASLENISTPVFNPDQFSREDLQRWISKAYKQFYLRPGYVLKRLKSMKNREDLIVNLKGLKMFLNMVK